MTQRLTRRMAGAALTAAAVGAAAPVRAKTPAAVSRSFWAVTALDAEATAAWYVKAMRLEVTHRLPPPPDAQAVLILDGPLALVEIAGRADALVTPGPTFRRKGLWKAGAFVPDLDAWIAYWTGNGVAFSGPMTGSGLRWVILTTPDNDRIQLFDQA